MLTVEQVIEQSKTKDNLLFLPDIQLERPLHIAVKKQLEILGGKWNTGKKAFVFPRPSQELIEIYLEDHGILDKNKFQFFPTPNNVIFQMLLLAGSINYLNSIFATGNILEPSAGQGHIIRYLQNRHQCKATIDCYEINPANRKILEMEYKNIHLFQQPDFLLADPEEKKYDLIIAKPPFTKNQDLDHIQHMYKFLAPAGTLVSVIGTHHILSENKKESSFRTWMDSVHAVKTWLPKHSFKDSGTRIDAQIIVIKK